MPTTSLGSAVTIVPELAGVLAAFAGDLRRAGLPAPPSAVADLQAAVAEVGPLDRARVCAASRAVICRDPEQLAVHDRVFARFFASGAPPFVRSRAQVEVPEPAAAQAGGPPPAGVGTQDMQAGASRREILRRADLGRSELRGEAVELIDEVRFGPALRRTRRLRRARAGRPELRRVVRQLLRSEELERLPRRAPAQRARRVTVICDVSASMEQWMAASLRFARRAALETGARCFAAGTRLSEITDMLRSGAASPAIARAREAVPDLGGGTRLGDVLATLLAEHSTAVRASVVVLISDGWEQGDFAALEAASTRLRRLAHRFVWVNPRSGRAGFSPAARGMRLAAAQAHVLIAGTDVRDWQAAADAISALRLSTGANRVSGAVADA
ncbi:VWA domain-containing protein [Brevibacterium sp. 5221]|uniref:VWA domain-containing protein n=1 Tax=Brevibacterium rongguiense TaxID=2695267 RepID=A0A6N9H3W4_9MICO|nr:MULTISPECIES: VWA domain-containing protein [Brevibacterium]MYM18521.1 VWA domain-containing protein [Brevibacterium rongguiense]WAL39595.1 VWA domain-containing protein [Brevibacterium sp. BRM-1]